MTGHRGGTDRRRGSRACGRSTVVGGAERSAPEQKTLPVAVRTTTRTAASAAAPARPSASSSSSCAESALRLCGESSVSVQTGPRRMRWTSSVVTDAQCRGPAPRPGDAKLPGGNLRAVIETDEHQIFRKTLRDLFEREIEPHVDAWEAARTFPAHELFPKLGAVGLLGLEYEEAYGGMGADHSFTVVAGEEMGRISCGGIPMAMAVQMSMATPALARYGSDELKEKYLAPSIRGELVASIAVTEPDAGSDVAGIRTRAVRDGDEWVINGSKLYITNGTQADWLCLLARTSEEPGYRGMSLIVVPTAIDGVVVSRKLEKLGMWSSDTAELSFSDVRVPVSNTIGEIGRGFQQQMVQFQAERLITVYKQVGAIELALRRTRAYLVERQAFGQPLMANQHLQFVLAELSARHDMLKHYARAAADAVLPRRGRHPLRHHRQADGLAAPARGGRRRSAVPRRHRLHGGALGLPLLPRHPARLHRRRSGRGDAAHPGPDGRLLGRVVRAVATSRAAVRGRRPTTGRGRAWRMRRRSGRGETSGRPGPRAASDDLDPDLARLLVGHLGHERPAGAPHAGAGHHDGIPWPQPGPTGVAA